MEFGQMETNNVFYFGEISRLRDFFFFVLSIFKSLFCPKREDENGARILCDCVYETTT